MMKRINSEQLKKKRIRANIFGTAQRPRLAVAVSNRQLTAQLIDDAAGQTLAYATSTNQKDLAGKNMTQKAVWVGERIAQAAKAKKIDTVVFDRGTHIYHGRVAALAGAAREKGLKF